jgi:ATP-binding cassette subfamily C (CFTR/MRP) protein 1
MIFLAPVNMFIFSIVSKQRRKVLKYSDLRVKMMNEILTGIRIIKFYAWERPFGSEVGGLRGKELAALTKLAYTSAIGFSLILMSAPIIQPILVFLTYVAIQNKPLDAATAFTTVALFNIMRFPFAFLPMGLLQYIQSRISLRRLERYLDLPELTDYVELTPPAGTDADSPSSKEGSVTIQKGTFTWVDPDAAPIRPIQDEPKKKEPKQPRRSSSKKKLGEVDADMKTSLHSEMRSSMHSALTESSNKGPAITLQDINCTIEAGSLVAVVGAVGTGKSSFLSAILGEMEPLHNSKVHVPRPAGDKDGYISYCAQTPWVVNATLRDNVLFGRDYVEERYNEVVEACALLDDLVVLPAGDMTEIGERGINLSGGQKARVSLARALYSKKTKIMLYDDPLSAVDAHVGEHIFAHAITGPLTEGTTRILVTHHVHLLSRCNSVIVLDRGRITHHGTYKDLVSQGVDFAGAVDISKAKVAAATDTTAIVADNDTKKPDKAEKTPVEAKKEVALTDVKKDALKKSGKKLVKEEEREEGAVAGGAYMHYGRAGGLNVAFFIVLVQGLGRASEVTAGFWLVIWARRTLDASEKGEPFSQGETNYYVGIYALFGFLGVLGLTVRSILVAVHRLKASKKLHDELTHSVLRAPVAFFDVTPTGRILNRFAADMDKIDLELTQSLSQGVSTIFSVLGAVAAMIVATKGTFLVPLIPMGYLYFLVQKWFRKTSTELQRINSVANSPIFADFSQTLSGTSTIRAYGEESRFFDQCKSSFDTMNASYILVQLTNFWLGLRLDVLGGLMGAFIGGVAVATSSSGFIPAGWLGLALSYSIEVTSFLKFGVRMIATVEAQMNSVERVLFYTFNIESEAPDFIPENDPEPGTWPLKGEIELKNASLRYRDGPLVLKDISLKVKAGEKVGVCGRTGSGKSSLMVLLFRISEIEKDGGSVVIDGVDAAEVGTSCLRQNLSIIPQDPVIFSNSVRYNLDPFKRATEEELWEVLKKVQMAEVIAILPKGLDEQVAEGGENFSQGQRQLLCIGRSLLRKPKVLVMDEATASIDNSTDAAIQGMIRENFKEATVLTIAHRLNTIMDSDRVLVLDDGEIVEYDTPEVLLSKKDGYFRAMIDKSHEAKSDVLEDQ